MNPPNITARLQLGTAFRALASLAAASTLLTLSGCSSLGGLVGGDKIDYKSASTKGPS